MLARSDVFSGSPGTVDDGVRLVQRELVPAVSRMRGSVGISVLVDRATGSSIVTTAWADAEAREATDEALAPLLDRATSALGTRGQASTWEIAVLHRQRPVPPGAWARVTWTATEPTTLEQQLYVFRVGTLPEIEDIPGFCSASLLVDRATGRAALAATYDSAESLAAGRGAAGALRAGVTRSMGAQVLAVHEYEVAVASLRVPETV